MRLCDILEAALIRRLYPHSAIGQKHVAHALGIDPVTFWRYRTGRTVIPADTLMSLIGFFRVRGDISFESEIMAVSHETFDQIRLAAETDARWSVERLPLDDLEHPAARHLARLAASTADLMTAADNAGLLPELSQFREEGGEVICINVGRSSQMHPAIRNEMVGRPLDRWTDFPYSRMVRTRVLDAIQNGPSCHALDGSVYGIHAPYDTATYPAGNGFVVTLTQRKGLAA